MNSGDASSAAHDPRYWAFISYSHADGAWADWLHRALETFPVPGRVQGRAGPFGSIPRRLYPVFRDRDELPTSANLSGDIESALRRSRTLLVICSPRSARSHWVNEEIRRFQAMGKAHRILCLIVDGEPNARDKPDAAGEECFAPALRFAPDPGGGPSEVRVEPIAADVRPGKDGRAIALLRIVAGLLGIPFDELRQRDRERRRRRMMVGAGAGLLLFAILGALAYRSMTYEDAAVRQAEVTADVWDALQQGVQGTYPQPDLTALPTTRSLEPPLSIYMPSGRDQVTPEAAALLDAFARSWQATSPSLAVLVAGHSSEFARDDGQPGSGTGEMPAARGREYALAIAQRHAETVKRSLVSRGIPASAITTMSFGKERPRHAMSLMNNRVEITVEKQP